LDRDPLDGLPMTVRVETLNARIAPQSWLLPALVLLSLSVTSRLFHWWQRRSSTLVMSDEWMHELRCSRDR
jgi:hypothetical protein